MNFNERPKVERYTAERPVYQHSLENLHRIWPNRFRRATKLEDQSGKADLYRLGSDGAWRRWSHKFRSKGSGSDIPCIVSEPHAGRNSYGNGRDLHETEAIVLRRPHEDRMYIIKAYAVSMAAKDLIGAYLEEHKDGDPLAWSFNSYQKDGLPGCLKRWRESCSDNPLYFGLPQPWLKVGAYIPLDDMVRLGHVKEIRLKPMDGGELERWMKEDDPTRDFDLERSIAKSLGIF
jgi:hypothetical protein